MQVKPWGKAQGATGKVLMLADGNGDFTKKIGLELDATRRVLGNDHAVSREQPARGQKFQHRVIGRDIAEGRIEELSASTDDRDASDL
mgnify:CR=1 FL=1